MAADSKIEWTHDTLNIFHGCTKINDACLNCYAESWSKRWDENLWGDDAYRKPIRSAFTDLAKYQKKAVKTGENRRVFVGSMMDIFERPMPLIGGGNTKELRDKLFNYISDGLYPNLLFLFLTKRVSNIRKMVPAEWLENPPANIMYGASVHDQDSYDNTIRHLNVLKGNTFLSIEPQLGFIKLNKDSNVKLIINGGESGPNRRPFDLDWARYLRDQCYDYGIPFFFKQVDKVIPIPEDLMIQNFPKL